MQRLRCSRWSLLGLQASLEHGTCSVDGQVGEPLVGVGEAWPVELAGQTAMLAGKRGLVVQAEGGQASGRLKTEVAGREEEEVTAGCGAGGPARPCARAGGGQVEAGDRPLGAPWLLSGGEEALVHRPVPPAVSGQRGLTAPLAFRWQAGATWCLPHRDPEDCRGRSTHRRRGAPGVGDGQ